MYFGRVLKVTRKQINLNQDELAKLLKCNRTDISKIENNKMTLSAERLIKWLKITGRPDNLAALVIGIEINTIMEKMFKREYLKQVYELGLLEDGSIKGKEDLIKLQEIINS